MNQINIIQFLPYFPPHKGGLESVGEEIGKYWVKNNFGDFIHVTSNFDQENLDNFEKIIFNKIEIGYKNHGYEVLVLPSFELINNFPIYKFWDKKYFLIKKYLKEKIGKNNKNFRIFTHTRFFLTSLIGGIFARKNKIKWIHIEHGSDNVKLSSKFKSKLSFIYDKIFGKWIFKKADKILAISGACKQFINKKFIKREVGVFYRGIDFKRNYYKKIGEIKLVFIGRLVKLKGVDVLLEAYKNTNLNIELDIIGDGDEKNYLEKFVEKNNLKKVNFLGFKDRDFLNDYLEKNKCIVINPSYQEGLPTVVIEGLFSKNIVIASDVGGTFEISNKDDLMFFQPGNIKQLEEKIKYALVNYDRLVGLSLGIIEEKFNWKNNILKLYNLIK